MNEYEYERGKVLVHKIRNNHYQSRKQSKLACSDRLFKPVSKASLYQTVRILHKIHPTFLLLTA